MPKINWERAGNQLKTYFDKNKHVPDFERDFHKHFQSKAPHLYDDLVDPDEPPAKIPKTVPQESPQKSTPGRSILSPEFDRENTPPYSSQESNSTPQTQTQSQSNIPQEVDVDMTLPGTGKGIGGSGDGNASGNMPLYKSIKPYTDFGHKTSTYKKVHRFLTFGIAHKWISETVGTENQRYLTTGLAEVPWHKPFLYLNDSEFQLLAPGSHVKEVRVKVICRGVRIAFETAATDSSLATLNQIQNIQTAIGLNKTGWGINQSYDSFNGSQSMLPETTAAPSYLQYPQYMYGNPNADIEDFIPNHQVGFKMPLYNYFCLYTKTENFGGCPPLAEYIEFMDGKTCINQVILETK